MTKIKKTVFNQTRAIMKNMNMNSIKSYINIKDVNKK